MGAKEVDIHLYWQTGCTSCLRAKEFLERNKVEFESHNIMDDQSILDDMEARRMPRRVPIIRRGDEWANAEMIDEVARIAQVETEIKPLPVTELVNTLDRVLGATQEYLGMLENDHIQTNIPNRPRSVGELCFHIFNIPERFLDHEEDESIRSLDPEPQWANRTTQTLADYGVYVQSRFRDWCDGPRHHRNFSDTANVYYGNPTVHKFLERTTWHSGQHTRQLEWMLAEEFHLDFDPLNKATWEGLPMPEKVWDASE